ncbi:MAG: RES family NAD+ phosphorylase [Gemmatimonadaceae bacterium]
MRLYLFGADGGVPAGYARCPAESLLFRAHRTARLPAWFGPAVGADGINRFDLPHRRTARDPGICYLAPSLEGVILETVVRDVRGRVLSVATLRREHVVTDVRTTRDLLLIDLMVAPWTVHGVQAGDISGRPPYRDTQRLAERLVGLTVTETGKRSAVAPDGIIYSSRFAPAFECLALWDRAADALVWGATAPLGAEGRALAAACNRLGIGLLR